MSSVQATRLRKGNLIRMGDALCGSSNFSHSTPGNKRGHVQCQLRDIRTNRLVDTSSARKTTWSGRSLDEQQMQFLYRDGDFFHFMNTETYDQIQLTQEVLGDQALYLLPEAMLSLEFYESLPVGIHLPQTVDLKVIETVPGIKGATAAAQVKPAKCETGLVVTVPAFVNDGDVIRINTETGEYQSRV
jgi:elongation factor P